MKIDRRLLLCLDMIPKYTILVASQNRENAMMQVLRDETSAGNSFTAGHFCAELVIPRGLPVVMGYAQYDIFRPNRERHGGR